MDQFKDLLDIASNSSNLSDNKFDTFLKENSYSEDDLSKRVLMEELFAFYACWHYNKYKKIPHRTKFTEGSLITKLHRIRQRNPKDTKRLSWGLKCSVAFRIAYLQFKKDDQGWQSKLKKMLNAKRAHQARKVNLREQRQLEKLLSLQDSIKDTSPK